MSASAVSIVLTNKGNSYDAEVRQPAARLVDDYSMTASQTMILKAPFLRIPPFPRAKVEQFNFGPSGAVDLEQIGEEIRRLKVGGTYWASQPRLPKDFVLVRTGEAFRDSLELAESRTAVLWDIDGETRANDARHHRVTGECDPWHMLSSANALVTVAEDELRLVAALIGTPRYLFDTKERRLRPDDARVEELLADAVAVDFENPFTGEPMSALEAVRLCGFWRSLIDSNRGIAGGYGFAFWKQAHVAPLLWDGTSPFHFVGAGEELATGSPLAVWRSRAPTKVLSDLQETGSPIIEVEDGFLRSRGLGADCIPPLSITVDRLGAHFDPSQPSELENLIERGGFDEDLLVRAKELRALIVEGGIGKYEQGGAPLERRVADRRHILVPGQVEDDRAVQTGGCGLTSNLELLKRVREQAPEAYILYKPHPDVLAGHRRGTIPDRACLEFADEVVGELPIASLIDMADEVHVNTSLAGFEALLRGKKVVTYGVPFYAGWGLTSDLGPVPVRRTARRTIDELVAATLLIYPRYLDPVSGLPCPAEIVVARLRSSENRDPGLLVGMRRLQGKLMRRLRSLVQ